MDETTFFAEEGEGDAKAAVEPEFEARRKDEEGRAGHEGGVAENARDCYVEDAAAPADVTASKDGAGEEDAGQKKGAVAFDDAAKKGRDDSVPSPIAKPRGDGRSSSSSPPPYSFLRSSFKDLTVIAEAFGGGSSDGEAGGRDRGGRGGRTRSGRGEDDDDEGDDPLARWIFGAVEDVAGRAA